ncbi:MAG TPA: hypothetical protein DIC22_11370, partial [Chitinophagaceae bacterium]|nr:hypothetical protein [Chitinophagaceae bacterium]
MLALKKCQPYLSVLLLLLLSFGSRAQTKVLRGVILDAQSGERVPFASMRLEKTGYGKLSDSAGGFTFRFEQWPRDTLQITYVGFQDYALVLNDSLIQRATRDSLFIIVQLLRGRYINEVVVSRKVDFGLLLWRKIVKHKASNDRYRFQNFSYELYNKLELDLNQVNKDRIQSVKLLKPFTFILNNIDSSETHPFLPIYITETLSDYYYQRSPAKRRELILGSKTVGLDNESVSKYLGGMEQNINFYNNFIPVFDKRFVSPLSNNGSTYYRYKIVDTQYVNARRLLHLIFTPKRKGESTFEGDCWVHDTSFAIQKMTLRLDSSANINFVQEMSLIQEFTLINDTTWFLSKDKFIVSLSALGKKRMGMIGRKTTTYKNIVYNDSSVTDELRKNKLPEEVLFAENARDQPDSFWVDNRHEELNKDEKAIYKMVDTLLKMPEFHTYANVLNFIGTGYLNIGNYQIGPWYNWIYANEMQGLRLRFDLGTNRYFNKNLTLHGYLAYGFGDQTWHWEADALYLFKRHPRMSLYGIIRQDLDYGQQYYDEITSDNIFALAVRKPNIPIKFINLTEQKLEWFNEWLNGFSIMLTADHKVYNPEMNLAPIKDFANGQGNPMNGFEMAVNLRFAFLEKFFETTFYRTSLGSDYPIIDVKYTHGFPGVLGSTLTYNKFYVSISDIVKIPPLGTVYYNLFAGKTTGVQPYPFLNVAPGNETYYYDKYAFSLMNKYEYLQDQFTGFNFEHNIGNGLFRFIPLTRKLKFRQFYNVKLLWGHLSPENAAYNNNADYTFKSLNGQAYMEVGTGVDNIFRFLRVDFIWHVLPTGQDLSYIQKFG